MAEKRPALRLSPSTQSRQKRSSKRLPSLGGKAVIWAGTPFCNKAEAVEVAHKLDEMAEMAEPYGIKIGYHNHSQEFFMDEGKTLLEHLLDNSTKCYSQLDCGWAQNGGCYPPSFIRRYKNRFVAIHVKGKQQGARPRPETGFPPRGRRGRPRQSVCQRQGNAA